MLLSAKHSYTPAASRATLTSKRQVFLGQEAFDPGGSGKPPFLNHVIVGGGFPVEAHSNVASSPSTTVTRLVQDTVGGTEILKKVFKR